MLTLPGIRVGEPIRYEDLTVFPLYSERSLFAVDYLLFHEAMDRGTVIVTEVSKPGSISQHIRLSFSNRVLL
jgi:hypothetical protein